PAEAAPNGWAVLAAPTSAAVDTDGERPFCCDGTDATVSEDRTDDGASTSAATLVATPGAGLCDPPPLISPAANAAADAPMPRCTGSSSAAAAALTGTAHALLATVPLGVLRDDAPGRRAGVDDFAARSSSSPLALQSSPPSEKPSTLSTWHSALLSAAHAAACFESWFSL
ncbi:hypothetical protein HK405_009889, partial [Cladochytrium tenue]